MDQFFGLDHGNGDGGEAKLLATVHDSVECDVLCGILRDEEIPFRVCDRGSGGAVRIITGYTMFGSDIYVPAALYDRAAELLEAYRNADAVDDGEIVIDPDDPDGGEG